MKTPSKSWPWLFVCFLLLSVSWVSSRADSLWTSEPRLSLVADKKAIGVGDIITVIVSENNTTKKASSTETAKKTGLDASLQSFLYSPAASGLMTQKGKLPAFSAKSDNSFQGKGTIDNSETITHRFGVRVVDVLPNGNFIVEGLRQTSFSGDSQTVILRGTVRPYDIAPNNTIFSFNLADVSIKLESSGAISNTQKKGWFSRAWDVLTPF